MRSIVVIWRVYQIPLKCLRRGPLSQFAHMSYTKYSEVNCSPIGSISFSFGNDLWVFCLLLIMNKRTGTICKYFWYSIITIYFPLMTTLCRPKTARSLQTGCCALYSVGYLNTCRTTCTSSRLIYQCIPINSVFLTHVIVFCLACKQV